MANIAYIDRWIWKPHFAREFKRKWGKKTNALNKANTEFLREAGLDGRSRNRASKPTSPLWAEEISISKRIKPHLQDQDEIIVEDAIVAECMPN